MSDSTTNATNVNVTEHQRLYEGVNPALGAEDAPAFTQDQEWIHHIDCDGSMEEESESANEEEPAVYLDEEYEEMYPDDAMGSEGLKFSYDSILTLLSLLAEKDQEMAEKDQEIARLKAQLRAARTADLDSNGRPLDVSQGRVETSDNATFLAGRELEDEEWHATDGATAAPPAEQPSPLHRVPQTSKPKDEAKATDSPQQYKRKNSDDSQGGSPQKKMNTDASSEDRSVKEQKAKADIMSPMISYLKYFPLALAVCALIYVGEKVSKDSNFIGKAKKLRKKITFLRYALCHRFPACIDTEEKYNQLIDALSRVGWFTKTEIKTLRSKESWEAWESSNKNMADFDIGVFDLIKNNVPGFDWHY